MYRKLIGTILIFLFYSMIGLCHAIFMPFSMLLSPENIILRMDHSAIQFSQNLVRMYVRLYLLIVI